jgi:MFS family permease
VTVTVPVHSKLADLYGRKPVMLVGVTLFLLGSYACGCSGSMGGFIAFRALQRLGAGAIQPIAVTIVGDLFDIWAMFAIALGSFGASLFFPEVPLQRAAAPLGAAPAAEVSVAKESGGQTAIAGAAVIPVRSSRE